MYHARDRRSDLIGSRSEQKRLLFALAVGWVCTACEPATPPPVPAQERIASGWSAYGGDPGGARYVGAREITPENVADLEVAWVYHTGDVSDGSGEWTSTTAFEATPILAAGRLVVCTPMNRVIALDPVTGAEHWTLDPEIDRSRRYANQLTCRGVAAWRDSAAGAGAICEERIFTATNDGRLIALDTVTGLPCADFGVGGEIDLAADVGETKWLGEFQVTSPPVVTDDVVIVGSAVSDNQRLDAPSGVVRAFDARSGRLRWAWDLAPPGAFGESLPRSRAGYALGTPNVWAPMSVDLERDLVFLPTGNAAPDYYRGDRAEMNHFGSSVIALRASTGELVWRFQTVHNDLWDFDVPAQPTLTTVMRDGRAVPAVVQATKMGFLFVLDRETGVPLFPVEERPVPQDGAPGEVLAATQPFPVRPPPLSRQGLEPADAWGVTPFDRGWCRDRIAGLRHDGPYAPPTLHGTVMFPGNGGGSNWGGVAVDPERQLVVANTMDLPWVVSLLPPEDFARARAENPGVEISEQKGARFAMRRDILLSPLGLPCNAPPWGSLAVVDLKSGAIRWQVPLGTVRDIAPVPIPIRWGVPNLGGPLTTASGLVFIAATMDDYLRAFDVETGDELWKARLPAGGQATPMSYRAQTGAGPDSTAQFVVIAAGGSNRAGTRLGDSLIAFALPR